MGVRGLWKVLEPAGRTVSSPEALANERVAVDASIWIYQFLRALPPAAPGTTYSSQVLAGLFNRVCKLLHYGVRPVLVFDGPAPALKRQTTRERAERRDRDEERYRRLARRIIAMQLHIDILKSKGKAPSSSAQASPENSDFGCFFQGSPSQENSAGSGTEDEFEVDREFLDNVDIFSKDFSKLPPDFQEEILWAKKEQVLKQHTSILRDNNQGNTPALQFSTVQIEAVVRRRRIAAQLERVKEGSVANFERDYLEGAPVLAGKIASDSNRSYILVKNDYGGWAIGGAAGDSSIEPETGKSQPPQKPQVALDEDEEFERLLFGSVAEQQSTRTYAAHAPPETFVIEKAIERFDEKRKEAITEPIISPEDCLANILPLVPRHKVAPKDKPPIEADHPLLIPTEKLKDRAFDREGETGLVVKDSRNTESLALPIQIVPASEEPITEQAGTSNDSKLKRTLPDQTDSDPIVDQAGVFEAKNAKIQAGLDDERLVEELQKELQSLREAAHPSHSASIDNELLEDFRTLLTIMGLPWMIAPGEAEAQCAWLQKNGHVDGVITDDNDAIVFGATRVYRHFFNNQKHISVFLQKDMERELGITDKGLVLLALLMGSDYSVGVRGIGPVKAIQLLKVLGQCIPADGSILETLKVIEMGLRDGTWPVSDQLIDAHQAEFLRKLSVQCAIADGSSVLKPQVIEAYTCPQIDATDPDFRWKLLSDVAGLTDFLHKKLRWVDEQCRQVLDPLVRRHIQLQQQQVHAEAQKQRTLDSFIFPVPKQAPAAVQRKKRRSNKD